MKTFGGNPLEKKKSTNTNARWNACECLKWVSQCQKQAQIWWTISSKSRQFTLPWNF